MIWSPEILFATAFELLCL